MYICYYSLMRTPFADNIIPVTRARGKLGDLAESVKGDNYIILTKGGSPAAALVDLDYLTNLEEQVQKTYSKTFIDPKLLPFTRGFSDSEIKEWSEEDKL